MRIHDNLNPCPSPFQGEGSEPGLRLFTFARRAGNGVGGAVAVRPRRGRLPGVPA